MQHLSHGLNINLLIKKGHKSQDGGANLDSTGQIYHCQHIIPLWMTKIILDSNGVAWELTSAGLVVSQYDISNDICLVMAAKWDFHLHGYQ